MIESINPCAIARVKVGFSHVIGLAQRGCTQRVRVDVRLIRSQESRAGIHHTGRALAAGRFSQPLLELLDVGGVWHVQASAPKAPEVGARDLVRGLGGERPCARSIVSGVGFGVAGARRRRSRRLAGGSAC